MREVRLAVPRDELRVEELEELWFTLQEEMTESGKVTRFPAQVVSVDGDEIDLANWTYDIGGWGWGNGELEYYHENNVDVAPIPGKTAFWKTDLRQRRTSHGRTDQQKLTMPAGIR